MSLGVFKESGIFEDLIMCIDSEIAEECTEILRTCYCDNLETGDIQSFRARVDIEAKKVANRVVEPFFLLRRIYYA